MEPINLEVVAHGVAAYLRAHAETLEELGHHILAATARRQAEELAGELELREPIARNEWRAALPEVVNG